MWLIADDTKVEKMNTAPTEWPHLVFYEAIDDNGSDDFLQARIESSASQVYARRGTSVPSGSGEHAVANKPMPQRDRRGRKQHQNREDRKQHQNREDREQHQNREDRLQDRKDREQLREDYRERVCGTSGSDNRDHRRYDAVSDRDNP